MAQVPEKVLEWLYSVLHEYHDLQRTYSDAARILAAYPSISPRTEVYAYENGRSALLLTLSGTLPVDFRGTVYRFPVKLWVPQSYPQEPPIVYITPGRDMLVRPGQHVAVDGRVYHPYLRDWQQAWDRASMAQLLDYLQQVFAKEPPVISKAQQQQFHQRPMGQAQQPNTTTGVRLLPQRPLKHQGGSVEPVEMPSTSTPPPKPPKPGEEYAGSYPQRTSSRDQARNGLPLPPLPHERSSSQQHVPSPLPRNGYAASPAPMSRLGPPQQPPGYQYGIPPGPLSPPGSLQHPEPTMRRYNRSPVSPVSPVSAYITLTDTRYAQAPALPQQPPSQHHQQNQHHQSYLQPSTSQHALYDQQRHFVQQPYQQPPAQPHPYPPNLQHRPQQGYQAPPPLKQPPPDLLSDPFDVALLNPSTSGPPAPAPPIPPNPEREHLLQALSTTLVQQAHTKVSQTLSAISPLQAQQSALRDAHQRLESEIRQLEHLASTLASNESILRASITTCDQLIQSAKTKPQPNVDEVLVAPTMVAQQLWNACAEEAGCREVMYVLQRAVDKGRVEGVDFVKQMRGLGREAFGKMVLARKCARGLGLSVGGRNGG
ncbi:Suppressor protein stp22 of temperature-sensitive alpha-factor receptor and arginine permease [Friedmanniomyces endolithicus]|uniref:Suppressor protein stp22 of temperature-sensitive alpha-factor receptor and arginine permease n=1 Tax=Friedmanniomyces endolithicus TaxID=329885 RepID=A0AAN6H840_9PEZI|nr:Suppressor protein stp22 of temperature-sensitive alpha-factor receptor and arginine permease [Friedmanniomyces endolithicus]KAK0896498.1 Suppressor protein stp22 of temperature-sensitive alpha-factor receptor and arginine permease [Friedmanniomyces endolithicus]KAK0959624.1 Suppressor protein stp22 of temperature-sensitive alpha-factor receptor and arginine permease [Friedmanniomyces endolithicus]KAK0959662.1 Suppressor protein stp22 of temperature-sensitive alpha-factor receptor and arginin